MYRHLEFHCSVSACLSQFEISIIKQLCDHSTEQCSVVLNDSDNAQVFIVKCHMICANNIACYCEY